MNSINVSDIPNYLYDNFPHIFNDLILTDVHFLLSTSMTQWEIRISVSTLRAEWFNKITEKETITLVQFGRWLEEFYQTEFDFNCKFIITA